MTIRVTYRIDAHWYDASRAACAPDCRACVLERPVYGSEEEALAAQPADELRMAPGDQGALVPPARRFELVIESFL